MTKPVPALMPIEYNFIKQGLLLLRSSLVRAVAKEPNLEIVRLKNEDIRSVNVLIDKLETMK